MENEIQIYNVLPTSFDFQSYAQDDITLLSASRLDTAFTGAAADPLAGDYIEFYAYDENKNLIFSNNPEIKAVSVTTFDVFLANPPSSLESMKFILPGSLSLLIRLNVFEYVNPQTLLLIIILVK